MTAVRTRSPRRRSRWVVANAALAGVLLLAGCGDATSDGDDDDSSADGTDEGVVVDGPHTDDTETGDDDPTVADPTGDDEPEDGPFDEPDPATAFTLHVSNQSFDDDPVGITISIDDVVVVDQEFHVEGQHNWFTFTLAVDPGVRSLRAVSSTGVDFTTEFTMPDDAPRWAVVDYWFYADEDGRHFSFHESDEPIAFA